MSALPAVDELDSSMDAQLDPACGSYRQEDVRFLLKPVAVQTQNDVQQKEKLIQSGQRHYSEMLSQERPPKAAYQALYQRAFAQNLPQLAADCLRLAQLIARQKTGPITLISLMRAGTPIGVIVKHLLEQRLQRQCMHFSLSIIRDRGLDMVALRTILQMGHSPGSIVFLDGWTGKGGITQQLQSSIKEYNQHQPQQQQIDDGLFVLSDLAGVATCAASHDDYLIPSAILNSTVSGLVSRSVLNEAIGPQDFHGCVFYPQFAAYDVSRQFVDQVFSAAMKLPLGNVEAGNTELKAQTAANMQNFLMQCQQQFGIHDSNLIKPGIGEATRALLRRAPRLLLLRDASLPAVAHLLALAQEKAVPVQQLPELPYLAVSLIQNALEA